MVHEKIAHQILKKEVFFGSPFSLIRFRQLKQLVVSKKVSVSSISARRDPDDPALDVRLFYILTLEAIGRWRVSGNKLTHLQVVPQGGETWRVFYPPETGSQPRQDVFVKIIWLRRKYMEVTAT